MTPPDPFRLFVYGTLMRGGPRHFALADQRFLGTARTAPVYDLLDLDAYPGLVRAGGADRSVMGELYLVAAAALALLDAVEGAPTLFRLEAVELADVAEPVFAYFYQPDAAGVPRYAAEFWDNGRCRGEE